VNLFDIANGAITALNPNVSATFYASTSYTTASSGKRTPTYAAPVTVSIQLQAMTEYEIKHMNALNIGGILRKVFGDGTLSSLVRLAGKGGDKLVIGTVTWLVVHVMEQWPDWCSVVVQQQVEP
jgi:hypothetical protein